MTNEQLKEYIRDRIQDEEELERIVVLEGDEFADGVIGITAENRLVYSYDKLVDSLSREYRQEDQTEEDAQMSAIEWLDYNTLRAIPYMESQGLLAPIIMYDLEI